MNEKAGRGVWDVMCIPYSCHFVSGQGRGSDVPLSLLFKLYTLEHLHSRLNVTNNS